MKHNSNRFSDEVDRIRDALGFVSSDNRDIWLKIGMAIKSVMGESGFEIWNQWSQQADSYDAQDAKDVWKSIHADGNITVGTLYYEAKANGWCSNDASTAPNQKAKEHAKIHEEQAKTASKAQEIWSRATEVKPNNPYLIKKRISPVSTMRETSIEAVVSILRYWPQAKGKLLVGRILVIPIKLNQALSTLELIDEDGRKAALTGRGTKADGFWAAQSLPDNHDNLTFLIGEGVATVLSAKQASGHCAIAALSSTNLLAVATQIRHRYPDASLIILADLLKTTREIDSHALKAAQSTNGRLAIPNFGNAQSPDHKDFNDMMILHGDEAVKQAIENATFSLSNTHSYDDVDQWPEPQPLINKTQPEPYPLDALPASIRAAITEVHTFTKAPIALVASSALSALSLAAQAQANVKRAEKLCGPTSIFLLTIADSGERKSTCDSFFTQAIREYDNEQAALAKPAIKDYQADIEAWVSKRNGIKDKIRQLSKEGNATTLLEGALRQLEHEQITPPRVPRHIYSDATPEALAYSLATTWPSGGILSAEAGIVFGAHSMNKDSIMRHLALLNILWDGGEITIDRKTGESFILQGARLTVGLQVQEATLHSFLGRSGELARGTGFLARFLLAWPESTQGYRAFTDAPVNWPALNAFNQRITAILKQPVILDNGMLKPILLSFTAETKKLWVAFHDLIEKELVSGGELYDVRDVASKVADNAARLAALFHLFESLGHELIQPDSLISASRIVTWHLNEAKRFFGELSLPVDMANASRLDSWLINYCHRNNTNSVSRRDVQRNVTPVHLRQKAALDNALRELTEINHVLLKEDGQQKIILVNPSLINKESI